MTDGFNVKSRRIVCIGRPASSLEWRRFVIVSDQRISLASPFLVRQRNDQVIRLS